MGRMKSLTIPHEETYTYDSCLHCPHRLIQLLRGCGTKEMFSRVQKRYRSAYFILKNDKGVKRLFFHRAHEVRKICCDKIVDLKITFLNIKLPSKKEFHEQCLQNIKRFYKHSHRWEKTEHIFEPSRYSRRVVEVIDVTDCLTFKEKYMFRKDYEYNCQHHREKKRWLWAHIWWDKYHDQAKQVTGFEPTTEVTEGNFEDLFI